MSSRRLFQTLGIGAPYAAMLAGVFLFRNGLTAVLFYHAVLLICIFGLTEFNAAKLLVTGFHRFWGPLLAVGGLVPGIVILYFWPIARQESVELSGVLEALNLGPGWFPLFAVYSCLVNPFLEEAFWRGGFQNRSLWPTPVDALFAGYHALAVIPVLKWPFVLLVLLALIFVGWLFRTVYRRSGGLAIPLLTHFMADIAILYAVGRLCI